MYPSVSLVDVFTHNDCGKSFMVQTMQPITKLPDAGRQIALDLIARGAKYRCVRTSTEIQQLETNTLCPDCGVKGVQFDLWP